MLHKIKVIKETACVMLTKEDEYVDSVFLNKYDFDNGNVTMEEIKEEANKLASVNNVDIYVFDDSEIQ